MNALEDVKVHWVGYGNRKVSRQEKSKQIRKKIEPEKGFYYSISHTDRYSMAAVSEKYPVGIDIELQKRLEGKEEVLNTIFPRDCPLRPQERWGVHEVLGKMEGTGLSEYYPIRELRQEENNLYTVEYLKENTARRAKIKIMNLSGYLLVLGCKKE